MQCRECMLMVERAFLYVFFPLLHSIQVSDLHHGSGKNYSWQCYLQDSRSNISPLTPNDHYSNRTALLTSKRFILHIYSTNIGTEYFKPGIYSSFFSSKCSLFHNLTYFGSCIIHILYTGCAKRKKNNSGAKRLNSEVRKVGNEQVFVSFECILTFWRRNYFFFNFGTHLYIKCE